MHLSAVPIALFLADCWVYCLFDAAVTPSTDFSGLRKRTWVVILAMTSVLGASAWLVSRRSRRARLHSPSSLKQLALGEYEAGSVTTSQAKLFPIGPDDNSEFLDTVSRRIKGTSESTELRDREVGRRAGQGQQVDEVGHTSQSNSPVHHLKRNMDSRSAADGGHAATVDAMLSRMLLPGVIIVAFLTCWWLFCLVQAAFTPADEFPGLGKGAWVALIAATFVIGAAAWVVRCESRRAQLWLLSPSAHPALRSRPGAPIGPDDDPEFLEQLGRRIRGTYETGE